MNNPGLQAQLAALGVQDAERVQALTSGMFTTLKVRAGLAANDWRDPGNFNHPPGTVAHAWQGEPAATPRHATPRPARTDTPGTVPGAASVRKPAGGGHPH